MTTIYPFSNSYPSMISFGLSQKTRRAPLIVCPLMFLISNPPNSLMSHSQPSMHSVKKCVISTDSPLIFKSPTHQFGIIYSSGGCGSGCQWVTPQQLQPSYSSKISISGVSNPSPHTSTGIDVSSTIGGICSLHLIHLLISHHQSNNFPRNAKK